MCTGSASEKQWERLVGLPTEQNAHGGCCDWLIKGLVRPTLSSSAHTGLENTTLILQWLPFCSLRSELMFAGSDSWLLQCHYQLVCGPLVCSGWLQVHLESVLKSELVQNGNTHALNHITPPLAAEWKAKTLQASRAPLKPLAMRVLQNFRYWLHWKQQLWSSLT